MKYWEIIANNLSKAGWSWGVVSVVTREGKTIFIADARAASNAVLFYDWNFESIQFSFV